MSNHIPEDILTAVLHRVGPRRLNDLVITNVFGMAAQTKATIFKTFALHPHYGYSPTLEESLVTLTHAGSIVREGLSKYFAASPHTLGPYGASVYEQLEEGERQAIDEIAQEIKTHMLLASD